jgi:DNA-binding transcriptional ArsR family regulator
VSAAVPRRPAALAIDAGGFRAAERAAAYAIGNFLMNGPLTLQRHFGLRAEAFQVLLLIVLATAQRYARAPETDPDYLDRRPLPPGLRGAISRRRIAEVLGVPLETVRRHVAELMARGLVEERARGQLATPGGTLARLSGDDTPRRIAVQLLAAVNTLLRHGVARIEPAEPPASRG